MSVYSNVALVLVGNIDWGQVERYARVGAVVCVLQIARSSVLTLESLMRMRMEPRVRITTRHRRDIKSLAKGLHKMNVPGVAAMLETKMTTPIECVDNGEVPWTRPRYHDIVSVVRVCSGLHRCGQVEYQYRHVCLSYNYLR